MKELLSAPSRAWVPVLMVLGFLAQLQDQDFYYCQYSASDISELDDMSEMAAEENKRSFEYLH